MNGDPGTCAFCGFGGGYLGDQGDETTQYLRGAVRTGEPGSYEYTQHPNSHGNPPQTVTWCGQCVGGLKHKHQRYDDTNLRAALIAGKVRLELDGLRWSHWEVDRGEEKEAFTRAHPPDDTAIHLDKLRCERDVKDAENETFRRYGHDLTKQGWRP